MESVDDSDDDRDNEVKGRISSFWFKDDDDDGYVDLRLKQNPHDVDVWLRRVRLFQGNPTRQILTYIEALRTVDPMKAVGNPLTLFLSFAKFYESRNNVTIATVIFEKALRANYKDVLQLTEQATSQPSVHKRRKITLYIVNATPLNSIKEPLKGFSWVFNEGDFGDWKDPFDHFGIYFKKCIESREDLQLENSILQVNPPFPRSAVLQILHIIRLISENCTNQQSKEGGGGPLGLILCALQNASESLEARLQYTRIRIYAFIALVQACGGTETDCLYSFFKAEPDFINELVTIDKS